MGPGALLRGVGRVVLRVLEGASRVRGARLDPWRVSLLIVVVAAVCVALVAGEGVRAQVSSERSSPADVVLGEPETARGEQVGQELVGLRTATSRTYEGEAGVLVARVFSGSVNFQVGDGSWQAIDNRLVDAPGGLRNQANHYGLQLPSDIGNGPVRVSEGGDWVSFALRGARGPVTTSGERARYANALAGVDVAYEAGADAVKEELVLADRAAARTFAFDVAASPGLVARLLESGTVVFEDGRGVERMAIAAPFMVDAAGEMSATVRASLEPTASGWRLELVAGDGWLDDPDRKWPVTVDPTVYPSVDRDCYIENDTGTSDSNFCAASGLDVGYGSSTASLHDHRALLKFDVQSGMPEDAEVLAASLRLWLNARSTTTSKAISAHRVTRSWTSAVTWNKHDGTSAWTTPGGEFESAAESQTTIGATATSYAWNVRELTEEWLRGAEANHGLLLKDVDSGVNNRLVFNASEASTNRPVLEIQYTRRIGERRGYKFERFQLSERLSAAVNPANGNLMVRQTDLTVPGAPGPDLTVARTYNSFGGAIFNSFRPDYGDRWELDTGHDIRLQIPDTAGDVIFQGPSGYLVRFERQGDGSYKTPSGFNATLVRNATDGTFTLTEHASQAKHEFGSDGRLLRQKDRNDRAISFAYEWSNTRVATITDSKARTTHLQYGSNGETSKMIDSAGREYLYAYSTSATGQPQLSTYTDPEGGITHFEYLGPNEQMSKITTPAGRVTNIDYYEPGQGTILRVKSITRVTASTTDIDPKTSFSYTLDQSGSSDTIVTDPLSHTTSYEFSPSGRPEKVTDALDRPTKRTYTTNANVENYTAPNNTGVTANRRLIYDGDDNLIDSKTMTNGADSDDDLLTHIDYGPTRTGGDIAGATHLPKFVRNEQDTASGNSSRGTAIEYENAEGNPTKFVKGTSGSVQLEYETGADGKGGRLDWTKDGNTHQTFYEYDGDDNLTSINPPASTGGGTDLGTTVFDYSGASGDDLALSRITKVTDGRANKAVYTYDDLDRIDVLSYTNSIGTEQARYEYDYDADGNLTERRDIEGTTNTYTFGYDDLGRLTSEGLPGGRTNTYVYDRASNLTSVTDAGGTVSYTYDAINRQATVQEPGAPSAIDVDYKDTKDNDPETDTVDHGQLITTTLPNGIATRDILDPAGRLLKTHSAPSVGGDIQRFSYEYELASGKQTLLRSTETDKDGNTVDYDYDDLDRLDDATDGADAYDYDYDAAGNITKRQRNTATPTIYRYNEANQLCWRFEGTSTKEDCDNDPPRPAGAVTFSYDADGSQISDSDSNSWTFNRRSQMTSRTLSGSSLSFAYAGPGQAERISIGSTEIVNNALGIASHTAGTDATYYTRGEAGGFLSQRKPSASAPDRRIYPLTDALGSTRALVDENGTVVRRYDFDPYGRELTVPGTWTASTRFRFAGGERDDASLYHFGQRYYSPTNGRWTQQDPINQPADIRQANRYGYVGGDPINLTDPAGERLGGAIKAARDAARYGASKARQAYDWTYRATADLQRGYAIEERTRPGRTEAIKRAAQEIAQAILDNLP